MAACYGEPLLEAIGSGRVEDTLVDRALERVLKQKCELGLLDANWSPEPPLLGEQEAALDDERSWALAREVAQRSVVLLCNNGTLPLPPTIRLALVGPRADVGGAMLGDYSFPMHVGKKFPDVPTGVEVPTLREVLETDQATYRFSYALGCPVVGGEDEAIAEAARVAEAADVCVAVLGDEAGMFGRGTSGEGCDAVDLRLPGRQEELLEALISTGTPVVLVLLAGRPYDISRQTDRLAAALCGFFPGEEGAVAISDILSGRVNPSGRLPISFPSPGGSQPGTYLGAPLAQVSRVSSVDPTPVFAFGHGLSYAPPTWLAVGDHSDGRWPTDATCKVVVALRNEHDKPTTEVVQVYLHDPVAEVAPADPAADRRPSGRFGAGRHPDGHFHLPRRPDFVHGERREPSGRPRRGPPARGPVEQQHKSHPAFRPRGAQAGGRLRPRAPPHDRSGAVAAMAPTAPELAAQRRRPTRRLFRTDGGGCCRDLAAGAFPDAPFCVLRTAPDPRPATPRALRRSSPRCAPAGSPVGRSFAVGCEA